MLSDVLSSSQIPWVCEMLKFYCFRLYSTALRTPVLEVDALD